jgi:hypothetical protein
LFEDRRKLLKHLFYLLVEDGLVVDGVDEGYLAEELLREQDGLEVALASEVGFVDGVVCQVDRFVAEGLFVSFVGFSTDAAIEVAIVVELGIPTPHQQHPQP